MDKKNPSNHAKPSGFSGLSDSFHRFAKKTAELTGSPLAFILALLGIGIWGILGPLFHFSDTWQLVVNTITTVLTFLIVFLIQNSQNRDAQAIHLKLDELIRSLHSARNNLIDLESMTDDELKKLQDDFQNLSHKTARNISPEARTKKSDRQAKDS